jgi:3-phosphoshikimate 1-carboxyvinyltransferase
MLQQFEVPFAIEDDALCITGVQKLDGGMIDAYNDHRIIMAAAIASVHSRRPVIINETEAVKKSYPGFFSDLNLLGIGLNII